MIEKRDLHIGCWYNFKNPMSGELVLVQFSNWSEGIDFEAYGEPIELSPEWMDRIGFEKNLGGYYMDIPEYGYMNYNNDVLDIGISGKYPIVGVDTKIKYVHELQNLYQSLTGEELTIKS